MDDQRLPSVPHIPGMHPRTMALVDALKTSTAETITDEDLMRIAKTSTRPDDQGPGYASLCTAIRHCRRNYGIIWSRVRGANCIRRLTAPEIVTEASAELQALGRRSKQTTYKLMAVDGEKLPEEDRPRYNAMTAQLTALTIFATANTTKKLEARNVDTSPDPQRLLEAILVHGR